jgi:hypothetical protein
MLDVTEGGHHERDREAPDLSRRGGLAVRLEPRPDLRDAARDALLSLVRPRVDRCQVVLSRTSVM